LEENGEEDTKDDADLNNDILEGSRYEEDNDLFKENGEDNNKDNKTIKMELISMLIFWKAVALKMM
jgi:hypothetical protein